tara:strand:+ start:202 stop:615 length:414 start_codon:yes stop_codon:yes gene_type:complete
MAHMIPKTLDNINTKVKKLGHIAIRVKDVERAKSFYVSLGMQLIWDDSDWCYLETSSGKEGLALLGPGYKAAGPHFAFHFKEKVELKKIHQQLKESGIQVGALHDHRDGTASFYLRDPEGNWLEMLYEPPDGIPTNQ